MDWKYLLGLELDDPGFDLTVLGDFRARLIEHGLEEKVLDVILDRCSQHGLPRAGGRQRTDSTHVLAAVRTLNRMEFAGETLRAALEALAAVFLRTWDADVITDALRRHCVSLRRWPLRGDVSGCGSDEVLARYRAEVGELSAREKLPVVDVVQLHPEPGPEWAERAAKARGTFLEEHRHAEDEVRFFAHGSGCFYLHLDDRVCAVVCEAGDLLSVAAETRHWFDMGPRPDFTAIRFFQDEDGWVGDFTGDPISGRFPRLDALMALAP